MDAKLYVVYMYVGMCSLHEDHVALETPLNSTQLTLRYKNPHPCTVVGLGYEQFPKEIFSLASKGSNLLDSLGAFFV